MSIIKQELTYEQFHFEVDGITKVPDFHAYNVPTCINMPTYI